MSLPRLIRLFPLLLLMLLSAGSWALNPDDLLPPERAFAARLEQQGQQLLLHLDVARGYYLYRERIQLTPQPAGSVSLPVLPAGEAKTDPYFGRQQVFHHGITLALPISAPLPAGFALKTVVQGCADAGLCYPPLTRTLKVGDGMNSNPWLDSAPSHSTAPTLARGKLAATLAAFFAAGLAMAFTACMYPLLPIVSSLIAGHGHRLSKRRGFGLSLAYVQGLALTYTAVGVAAGLTGSLLTVWLQQPAVILTAAALMVLFALAMFDVISIQLPAALQSRLASTSNRLSGGHVATVFAMGALSALLIGPCVAPPLAVALGYIGQSGDALLGGAALYAMALGLGLPLLLVGTFGGHVLPRAGQWMNAVKAAFGCVMLGVAIWMAGPFLPTALTMLLWSALALGIAWQLLRVGGQGLAAWLRRLLAVLFTVAGLLQIVGAATGAPSPRLPWAGIWHGTQLPKAVFTRVASNAELDAALARARAAGQPVLLDFYADWCVSCVEMEETTFRDPAVRQRMDHMLLLQADVTANNPAQQAMLKRFGLYGPPGIMLYDAAGRQTQQVIGYQDAGEFVRSLDAANPGQ
ncbi:protein-disulfide reductase DsbD [Vogesella sp. LIG4]|uniref:protein-disulfide reductase DsbD n=1 Tax=Vogesella sp. LIG4 TaxID=1192162 RepID=UPI00081FF7D6|nr:protein-disulfide reductase DsbD [Vogesella sp. LIG4]SCK22127.1 thiol:disulfide interchange protein DsbD [Vogesella sp. LIG4]